VKVYEMNRLTKLAWIVLVSIVFFGLGGASEYPFGSKVMPTDSDVGKPLFNLPVATVGAGTTVLYWETGVIPGYDTNDVVYLHVPGNLPPNTVAANDVRLTPFGNLPAGSKVTPQDNDIGQPLLVLPPVGQLKSICYLDLYGSSQYDFMDPVYVHRSNLPVTIVRDVRLTDANGLEPGTKVRNFDLDMNRRFGGTVNPITLLPQIAGGPIKFFDVNGNGVYDYLDDVYLNFPAAVPAGTVVVNNIRLSAPIS
jgi:hypothetical protein